MQTWANLSLVHVRDGEMAKLNYCKRVIVFDGIKYNLIFKVCFLFTDASNILHVIISSAKNIFLSFNLSINK